MPKSNSGGGVGIWPKLLLWGVVIVAGYFYLSAINDKGAEVFSGDGSARTAGAGRVEAQGVGERGRAEDEPQAAPDDVLPSQSVGLPAESAAPSSAKAQIEQTGLAGEPDVEPAASTDRQPVTDARLIAQPSGTEATSQWSASDEVTPELPVHAPTVEPFPMSAERLPVAPPAVGQPSVSAPPLTRHDTRAAPEDENMAVMPGFPHPDPLPKGEGDKEHLRRIFTVTDAVDPIPTQEAGSVPVASSRGTPAPVGAREVAAERQPAPIPAQSSGEDTPAIPVAEVASTQSESAPGQTDVAATPNRYPSAIPSPEPVAPLHGAAPHSQPAVQSSKEGQPDSLSANREMQRRYREAMRRYWESRRGYQWWPWGPYGAYPGYGPGYGPGYDGYWR